MSDLRKGPVRFVGYPPKLDRDPSVLPKEVLWDHDRQGGPRLEEPNPRVQFKRDGEEEWHLFEEEPCDSEDPPWCLRWVGLTDPPREDNVGPRIWSGPRIREADMKIKNNVRTDVRGEVLRQIQRPPFMDSRSRQMFRDALGGDDRER